MPCYDYLCKECNDHFQVYKSIAEYQPEEPCECGRLASRIIHPVNFNGAADWNNQTYCPIVGKYVKSDAHRRKIAKQMGMEEVGNEDLNKFQAQKDKELEAKIDKDFEDAAKDAYNSWS